MGPAAQTPRRIALLFTLWMLFWVPVYAWHRGPQNFLWICDVCNFVLLVALWRRSRLLFSSQFVAVLLLDLAWAVDVTVAALFRFHPIGGTEYMFDSSIPPIVRFASSFHLFVPAILIWGVRRFGYDSRGFAVQCAIGWVLLPLSYFLTDPARNINWVFGPFGRQQTLVDPGSYLLICMVLYPLVVFLPTHALARLALRRRPLGCPDSGPGL